MRESQVSLQVNKYFQPHGYHTNATYATYEQGCRIIFPAFPRLLPCLKLRYNRFPRQISAVAVALAVAELGRSSDHPIICTLSNLLLYVIFEPISSFTNCERRLPYENLPLRCMKGHLAMIFVEHQPFKRAFVLTTRVYRIGQ